jgi:hypothetical protein
MFRDECCYSKNHNLPKDEDFINPPTHIHSYPHPYFCPLYLRIFHFWHVSHFTFEFIKHAFVEQLKDYKLRMTDWFEQTKEWPTHPYTPSSFPKFFTSMFRFLTICFSAGDIPRLKNLSLLWTGDKFRIFTNLSQNLWEMPKYCYLKLAL